MRSIGVLIVGSALVLLGGCTQSENSAQQHHEANTVPGKMGQVAHRAAVAADKAGRVVGKQLAHAAHDAKEGWKEDEQRTKDKR